MIVCNFLLPQHELARNEQGAPVEGMHVLTCILLLVALFPANRSERLLLSTPNLQACLVHACYDVQKATAIFEELHRIAVSVCQPDKLRTVASIRLDIFPTTKSVSSK